MKTKLEDRGGEVWERFADGFCIELFAPDIIRRINKLERERNEWKANHDNHDNHVELKRIISDRPDMAERAPMVEKLMEEKQQAEILNVSFHMRIRKLESAIRNLRDVKGRHHSEQAYAKLVAMLPESNELKS